MRKLIVILTVVLVIAVAAVAVFKMLSTDDSAYILSDDYFVPSEIFKAE